MTRCLCSQCKTHDARLAAPDPHLNPQWLQSTHSSPVEPRVVESWQGLVRRVSESQKQADARRFANSHQTTPGRMTFTTMTTRGAA